MATSTLGSGTLVLAGTTSGTTTVTATAVAGTTTLTLPAATDTLVGKATTDTLTNKTLTGAVMNGTLGATTPSAASVTTLTTSSTITHNGGTANGVPYLNGSKVLTTGSALVFDGTNFSTTGTIKGSTTIGVGAATPSTSGAGITFPATDSPSSNANTLDDYEEGAWTPSIGGTATYTTQVGHYTKIGKQVTLIFDLAILLLGTGSTTTITGAPFVPAANIGNYHTGSVFWETIASSQISVGTFIQQSTSQIFFYTRSTAGTSVVNASAIIGSGTILRGTLTYFV